MTENRYIYASVGVSFEILDSWFGYTGDDEPTEREIEEYDFLVIGLAPDKDAADGICRRLNDQQDEINHLSNFGLHVILDKKNKEIKQLKQQNEALSDLNNQELSEYEHRVFDIIDDKIAEVSDEKYKAINQQDVSAMLCFEAMIELLKELRNELKR